LDEINIVKEINSVNDLVKSIRTAYDGKRELSLVITNLEQARMWYVEWLKKDYSKHD